MTGRKVVVHTDVIVDHLLHEGDGRSAFRIAMGSLFCYTTVFNAIELFSLARTGRERRMVERSLSAMKILGLNAKHARHYGVRIAGGMTLARMNTLIAGICLESRLPILTGRPSEFRSFRGLVVVPVSAVKEGRTGAEMLKRGEAVR